MMEIIYISLEPLIKALQTSGKACQVRIWLDQGFRYKGEAMQTLPVSSLQLPSGAHTPTTFLTPGFVPMSPAISHRY